MVQLCLHIDQHMSSRPKSAPRTLPPASLWPKTINPLETPPPSEAHTGAGEPMQLGHASLDLA